MPFVEFFLLRLFIWLGLLSALVALAVGPRRLWRGTKRAWAITWRKRLDPEEILTRVVEQHQQHVKAVRAATGQAEQAEAAIREHLRQSEEHVKTLAADATRLAEMGDELGARAALYKINLERSAIENFREQLERQCSMVAESRHRLYLLELQLRQYEVGRSILLSQLAQAEKVEEQYAIARRFDPFNAVANWQKAEGFVQEKALNARAIERVYADTSELAAAGPPTTIDSVVLQAQLAELRMQLKTANRLHNCQSSAKVAADAAQHKPATPGDAPQPIEQRPSDPENSS
jgi:phage shock protein A